MRGLVHDRILRTRTYTHVSVEGSDKVDCAYLVTIGNTAHLASQVARLVGCAQKVIVLHTSSCRLPQCQTVEFIPFEGALHDKILALRSSSNPTLKWNRQFDIPSKRNFAIEHARIHGFRSILLVDDDVLFRQTFVPSAMQVLRAGADIACAYSLFHPDISTLDRIHSRVSGSAPEVTIGGNAVVLKVGPRLGLFPYIYNEDWLFFWSSMQYGSAAVTAFQNVAQRAPRTGRESLVEMEQFGELVTFILFYQHDKHSDLTALMDLPFVEHCISTYRRNLQALRTHNARHSVVSRALAALDQVTPSDVCMFARNLESDMAEHYERSVQS